MAFGPPSARSANRKSSSRSRRRAPKKPDYLRMACASASTSFRDRLRPDELAQSLLTGKVPANRRPHLRALLEEVPAPVLVEPGEGAP